MTDVRTLAEMGDLVARDGPAAHDSLLRRLAVLVSVAAPGTAAVLADSSAPAVVRQRAVAIASQVLLRQRETGPTALGLTA